MAMTITPDHDTEFAPSGRRRKITKFALAGVAVLGVGAALTSAAWSDNVFFGGDASTATLDLEGSADGVNWAEGDNAGLPITIPELENVGPGQTDTHTVYVRNKGSVDVYLNQISIDAGVGPLFQGVDPAIPTIGAISDVDRILGPGQSTSIVVQVTGDSDWTGAEYTNLSGFVTVTVAGTSDIPVIP